MVRSLAGELTGLAASCAWQLLHMQPIHSPSRFKHIRYKYVLYHRASTILATHHKYFPLRTLNGAYHKAWTRRRDMPGQQFIAHPRACSPSPQKHQNTKHQTCRSSSCTTLVTGMRFSRFASQAPHRPSARSGPPHRNCVREGLPKTA